MQYHEDESDDDEDEDNEDHQDIDEGDSEDADDYIVISEESENAIRQLRILIVEYSPK